MVKPILNKKKLEEVKETIKAAELETSGEIRVSVFKDFAKELKETEPEEALRTLAHQQFVELGITNTRLDNGVLILLVVKPRRFIIWGDTGINEVIPEGRWQELAGTMSSFF
ncbi:MAG: TPM domain-containing protein, partial [Candidatus Zixiibacteriota bacterium]